MKPEQKKEFYEWLSALREDDLTPEQFEQLDQLLGRDAAARREYVRFMNLCLDIKDFEEAGILTENVLESSAGDSAVSVFSPVDPHLWRALSLDEKNSPFVVSPEPQQPEPALGMNMKANVQSVFHAANTKRSLLTLFGSLAALMLMVLYVHLGSPTAQPYIATLTRTADDAKWINVTGTLIENGSLCAGPLHLAKGSAEIITDNGSQIILQAPVEMELESPSQLLLKKGRVTVNIAGGKAMHFVVRTPTACVVDFGTEFGVAVDDNNQTITHVFQGEVELRSGSNPLRFDSALKLAKGQAGQADLDGEIKPRQADPARFVRSSEFDARHKASKGSSYHRWKAYSYQLRRDPALVAYYTFERDSNDSDMLFNMAAATQGKMNGQLTSQAKKSAPTWEQGRWPEKTALSFNRNRNQIVGIPPDPQFCINGPVTVAAWIHIADSNEGGHIVSCRQEDSTINYQLGYRSPTSSFWNDRIQLARRRSTEKVEDIRHSRQIPEQFGWLLVAATHDNQTLKYYLNGQLIDVQNWIFKQDAVEAGLMIGTTFLESRDDSRFDGKIGEIAIFRRVLDEEEIAAMYQAGKP